MPIANVTLNNTFDEWRTTTNQLIAVYDETNALSLLAYNTSNGAFAKANAALANTSTTFSGNLTITGNLRIITTSAIVDLL